MTEQDVAVPHAQLLQMAERILRAWGMPEDLAHTTAELMCQADVFGIDSHGVSMLPIYEAKLRDGSLQIDARPRTVRQLGATAVVDGGAGLGHPAGAFAMRTAIELAQQHGVGVVVATNSHHFGAAGVYARLALAEGLIGWVGSSATNPILVPTGARQPALGTNPLAFAAPGLNGDAFVLDMATTTVAANKVRVYDYRKRDVPAGWVVDGQGGAVTDSAQALDWIFGQALGGLTPLGGTPAMSSHKGYGLAMMVQILSATLSGAAFCGAVYGQRTPGAPDDVGHFLMALDPAAFRGEGGFENDLSDMLGFMRGLPSASPDGVAVQVAGDPEVRAQAQRSATGIPISAALYGRLKAVCDRCGVAFGL